MLLSLLVLGRSVAFLQALGVSGLSIEPTSSSNCCSLRLTGLILSSTQRLAVSRTAGDFLLVLNKLLIFVVNISLFFYVVDQALNVDFVSILFDIGYSILLRTLCGFNVCLFWTFPMFQLRRQMTFFFVTNSSTLPTHFWRNVLLQQLKQLS